jgi:uncharacterized protein (DUF2062 family)
LWARDKRAIAGGLALGCFVALTPTFPFQMILAALGAVRLKVNLVVALAACWITNPFTAVPIYVLAWRLGRAVLHDVDWLQNLLGLYSFEGSSRLGDLLKQSVYLWTGSLILASVVAACAYAITIASWGLFAKAVKVKAGKPSPSREQSSANAPAPPVDQAAGPRNAPPPREETEGASQCHQ